MKSNTSLVLFAIVLFSLNISCADDEPSDVYACEPTPVRNLRRRLHAFSFESFLPQEIRNDQQKKRTLGLASYQVGMRAREFIRKGNVDLGYTIIFYAIKDISIKNSNISVTINKVFNGKPEIVEQLIKCLAHMFVSDVLSCSRKEIW